LVPVAVVLVDAMMFNQPLLILSVVTLLATHGAAFYVGHQLADNERLEQAAEFEAERAALAAAAQTAEAAARAEEQRRVAAVEEIRRGAQEQLDRVAADAAAARTAGNRLRDRVAILTAACSRTPGDPAAAAGSPPTADTRVLLADVFSEVERTGREMAAAADRARLAGAACERAYDALNTPAK
jgi:hypothetical protein